MDCTIPDAVKRIWMEDSILFSELPASDNPKFNRFFTDGVATVEPLPDAYPYAVLEDLGLAGGQRITGAKFTGNLLFRIQCMARNRLECRMILWRARRVFADAPETQTEEGTILKFSPAMPQFLRNRLTGEQVGSMNMNIVVGV